MLRLPPGGRALEIGTGSGYQAAILAALGHDVFTIEIIPALAQQAATRLSEAGFGAVEVRQGDGYFGWPDKAPFDGIVVTAAAPQIPPPLLEQLKPGGRMVIPVGAAFLVQQLILVEKLADGTIRTDALLPVAFVPLTRQE
jgi:protein-L-isoaspartate(D-aspartate) O-methyltransferase